LALPARIKFPVLRKKQTSKKKIKNRLNFNLLEIQKPPCLKKTGRFFFASLDAKKDASISLIER
jgi:hypothetical protein